MNLRSIALYAAAALILGTACSTPASDTAEANVSRDMATLAAGLTDQLPADLQASMVNEASASTETSTPVSLDISRSASSSSQATVVVTHSLSTHLFSVGDVVQVVRTWTDSHGETIVDTVTRPKLPASTDYTGSPTYTPVAGNGIDVTGVSASFDGTLWSLVGTETKTIDGVAYAQQTLTQVYALVDSKNQLVEVQKRGEAVGLLTTRVKLDTTIWYSNGAEYLRVLDYVKPSDSSPLKREVYLWNVDPNTLKTQSWNLSNGSALSFLPILAAEIEGGTIDFWYRSDPSVAVSTLKPVEGTFSTYPLLKTDDWTGAVLQEKAPRISDWYKPVVPSTGDGKPNGAYVRAVHREFSGTAETLTHYGADGTTVLKTSQAAVCRSTADGTITTTWTFADGKTRKVSITPTTDASGTITGYTLVRGSVTYTAVFTFGTDGRPSGVTVTDQKTGTVVTYTLQADGTWA